MYRRIFNMPETDPRYLETTEEQAIREVLFYLATSEKDSEKAKAQEAGEKFEEQMKNYPGGVEGWYKDETESINKALAPYLKRRFGKKKPKKFTVENNTIKV